MSAFHLFTIKGIPVSASPFYFLLLLLFARGSDLIGGLILAVAITLSLLVHELGHALVARYLKHDPSIMLHGFGGLTSRTRTGRDVEEAAIIAMGPAAGLALGLLIFGLWQLLGVAGLELGYSLRARQVLAALLYPCIVWNLLNLIPLWPLDGGQLFRLGVLRFTQTRRADVITHGVALLLIAALGVWAVQVRSIWAGLVLLMLAVQNVRALRGEESSGPASSSAGSPQAEELIEGARQAFVEARYREAARLAQQARALVQISPAQLDQIWEILGLANTELGEHEEALAYLRRAKPTEATLLATQRCLGALGRSEELVDYKVIWQGGAQRRGPDMRGWLIGALTFIAVALAIVFNTWLISFVT